MIIYSENATSRKETGEKHEMSLVSPLFTFSFMFDFPWFWNGEFLSIAMNFRHSTGEKDETMINEENNN